MNHSSENDTFPPLMRCYYQNKQYLCVEIKHQTSHIMDFVHYSFKHYSHADACRNDLVAAGFNTDVMECADDNGRTVYAVHPCYKDYDQFNQIKDIARPHERAEIDRNKPTRTRLW